MTKINRSLLLIILLLVVLPLTLLLVKQRQELRKKAAANDMSVFLADDTIAPGGTTTGGVTVEVGQTPIDTAAIRLTYDSNKISVSEFNCGSGLNESPSNRDNTAGNLLIVCSKPQGFTSTFGAATFTVTAGSVTGDVNISLGTNTQIRSSGSVLTGNLYAKILHISSAGAEVPVFFSFGSSAVSPGGSNSGTVKVNAGTSLVKTARVIVVYDKDKVSVSNLACQKQNPSNFPNEVGLEYRAGVGEAEITCSSATGVTGNTFDIASFRIQVLSTAPIGSTTVSFGQTSKLWTTNGVEMTASFTPGAFQIVQAGATPTPTATAVAGNYFTPTCAVRSLTQITASGSGFGSSGNVILVTPVGGTANIAIGDIVSWSDTAVLFKVSSGFPFGQYDVKINSISLSGRLTVADSCVVATPTPTATAVVTPSPTTVAGTTPTPTATTVAGNTFIFKLKFYAINAKPTTPPNIAGLDYGYETARVTIKSGTTVIYTYPATLNAGDGGVYTSVPVVLADMRTTPFGSFPAGTYNLYVKPVGYYQKRFAGKAIPSGEVIDLTSSNYRFEPGDLNNDGVINLIDLDEIVNFIKTTDQSTVALAADKYKKYDYDRNGIVNAGDTAGVIETMNHRYDDE